MAPFNHRRNISSKQHSANDDSMRTNKTTISSVSPELQRSRGSKRLPWQLEIMKEYRAGHETRRFQLIVMSDRLENDGYYFVTARTIGASAWF